MTSSPLIVVRRQLLSTMALVITLLISISSTSHAQTHMESLSGTIREFIVEHSTREDSHEFALITESAKVLLDTRDVSDAMRPLVGRQVRVIGYRSRHKAGMAAFRVTAIQPFLSAIPIDEQHPSYRLTGRHSIAVVTVAINSFASSCSKETATAIAQEATSAIRDSTFGHMDFQIRNESGEPTVFGPVTISTDISQTSYFDWEQLARKQLSDDSVDLTPFQHVIFIFPSYTDLQVPWAGLAWQNCSVESTQCSSYLSHCATGVMVHELGHELGLVHSARDWDSDGLIDIDEIYSDSSTPMGGHEAVTTWSAFQRDKLGVYDQDGISPQVSIKESGQYTVVDASIKQSRDGTSPVFRVYFPETRQLYYFTHHDVTNRPSWFRWDYGGGLNIHKVTFTDLYFIHQSQYTGESLLLARLIDGETYTDNEGQFTVTQISNTAESTTFEFSFLRDSQKSGPSITFNFAEKGEVLAAGSQLYGEVVTPERPFHAIDHVDLFLNGTLITKLRHFAANRFPFYLNPRALPSGAVPHGAQIDTIASASNILRAVAYDLNGNASEPIETQLLLAKAAWQHLANPEDVTRDGVVDYADMSAVQECILGDAGNQGPSIPLPDRAPLDSEPLVDVDGDGRCSDADIKSIARKLSLYTKGSAKLIMGKVVDLRGTPLKGVFVELLPETLSTITDANGNFLLFAQNLETVAELYVESPPNLPIDFEGSGYRSEGGIPVNTSSDNPMIIRLHSTDVYGDIDGDKELTARDIDALREMVVYTPRDAIDYDFNEDKKINIQDLSFLIERIIKVPYGDINFDRCFDSSDLIIAFQGGAYEASEPTDQVTWSGGDFNHDGVFDSGDLVFALQKGSYPFCADVKE